MVHLPPSPQHVKCGSILRQHMTDNVRQSVATGGGSRLVQGVLFGAAPRHSESGGSSTCESLSPTPEEARVAPWQQSHLYTDRIIKQNDSAGVNPRSSAIVSIANLLDAQWLSPGSLRTPGTAIAVAPPPPSITQAWLPAEVCPMAANGALLSVISSRFRSCCFCDRFCEKATR